MIPSAETGAAGPARKPQVEAGLLSDIIEIAKQNHVGRVILFGSRARGEAWSKSDIDLAVTGGDTTGFMFDVDEKANTLLYFDVVNLDEAISPKLAEEIRRDGIVLYDKV